MRSHICRQGIASSNCKPHFHTVSYAENTTSLSILSIKFDWIKDVPEVSGFQWLNYRHHLKVTVFRKNLASHNLVQRPLKVKNSGNIASKTLSFPFFMYAKFVRKNSLYNQGKKLIFSMRVVELLCVWWCLNILLSIFLLYTAS